MKYSIMITCFALVVNALHASESNEPAPPSVDANQDGKISHQEFAQHHAREVFILYDVDGDGKITKKEVEQIHQENPSHARVAKVTLKHDELDKNQDEVVTMDEMEHTVKMNPEVKTIFHGISRNAPQDNWVSQAEYDSWSEDPSFDPEGQGFTVMSISP